MPERMLNPYDFVPLETKPELVTVDHARVHGLSGVITYTLRTLTPVCIHQNPGQPNKQRVYEFARLGNQPAVPATSLKGMLRSVHEIVTNSAMGLIGSRAWHSRRIAKEYLPGERQRQMTKSEALFGMVSGKGEDSVGYAGRLLIGDIPVAPATLTTFELWRPKGGKPEPEHNSFYFEPGSNGTILGRKLYYHQDHDWLATFYRRERARASEARKIEIVPPRIELPNATLRFFNLQEAELAALVYALQLEPELAHKLGYGKPLGLGSVRLQITKLEIEQMEQGVPARFLIYDDGEQNEVDTKLQSSENNQRFESWMVRVGELVDDAKHAWLARPQGKRSYAAFAAIAHWQDQMHYVYPDYDFFRNEKGARAKTTLWHYQGRTAYHPGASAAGAAASGHPQPGNATLLEQAPSTSTVPGVQIMGDQTKPSAPTNTPKPPLVRTAIDLRPFGQLKPGREDEDLYIEGSDGKRYLLQRESTATLDLLRQLLDQVRAGKMVRVRYRPERQKVAGKNMNVARDVEPVEEGRQ